MLKKVSGSKIIRTYDKTGNFVKEFNIIEYKSSFFDWLIFLAVFLPGIVLLAHYG